MCPSLSAPDTLPSLTWLLSADRLAHPEGSLPDLAMMKLTASLEVAEVKQLAGPVEETPGGCPAKAKKGKPGRDSEDEDEDEDEEDEEEEETSGKPPAQESLGCWLTHGGNKPLSCPKGIKYILNI